MTVAPAGSDLILARDRARILHEILAARSAFVPDWLPAPLGAGHGLAEITAGQLELLQERLKHVPEHRLAVLLDLLGASRLPAQGARTHVLLTAPPGTANGRVAAGTRIGAAVPGRDVPVVFETQQDVAISSAVIAEVHSVLPRLDAESDHSADVLGHRPLTLFGDLAQVDRELYISHDELLAFDGRAVVELEVGVAVPPPYPLALEWSWWDGTLWRPFADVAASPLDAGDDGSVDGTQGLTRSGTIRLVAPVATAVRIEVDGREMHWIRGRLAEPFTLPEGAPLPTISRLRLAVVNEHRRLRLFRESTPGVTAATLSWPEAPTGAVVLHLQDETTPFELVSYDVGDPTVDRAPGLVPAHALGAQKGLGDRIGHLVRFGASPAASRTRAVVDLKPETPRRVALDTLDDRTSPQVVDADTTLRVVVQHGLALDKGVADRRAVDLTKTFAPLGPAPERGTAFLFACGTATARPRSRVTLVLERPVTAAERADSNADLQRDAARATATKLASIVATLKDPVSASIARAIAEIDVPLPEFLGSELVDAQGNPKQSAAAWFGAIRAGLSTVRGKLGSIDTEAEDIGDAFEVLGIGSILTGSMISTLTLIPSADAIGRIDDRVTEALTALTTIDGMLGPGGLPSQLLKMEPYAFVAAVKAKLATIRGHLTIAQGALIPAIAELEKISPAALAVELARSEATSIAPPRVEWEYHDGRRWRSLGVEGDPRVLALLDSGSVHFTVPDDIADVDIDGDTRRWLRARLADGAFAHMSLVSWTDKVGTINFLPVVEPRPPLLDSIQVFYTHRSPARDADAVLAHDVHRWTDVTREVTWPSDGGSPFAPMPEAAPTIYIGADAALPADWVGLWIQPADPSPWATPHRPVWEGWDGRAWVRLAVQDGTDGLRREGVVRLLWPGADSAPGVTVVGALGTAVALAGRGAALRFTVGDKLLLSDAQGQVPVEVAAVEGETITARRPLPRAFAGARLTDAPPARFGEPRTWMRAVFDPVTPPPEIVIDRLAAHAVEVAQIETIRDEVLGSGDGSPGQVLTARQAPIEGEAELEVRELDGERADLDRAVLERTLVADGVDLSTVRIDRDQRSGRVSAVWVTWRPVSSLGAADPGARVFVTDRVQGRFLFGGGAHGRAVPAGRDNVRLRRYATTLGPAGNVEAGAISQLLSAVPVAEAVNPVRASGGAAVEPLEAALRRSPALLRHRRVALTEADVEAIAIEASPAVVRARALGATDRWGRPSPGAVRVVIVPRDGSAQPFPSAQLLAVVRTALVAASPAVAVPRVTVEGPLYRPVGVALSVIPLPSANAGATRERVVARLDDFLHPLRGGGDGAGWDFGAGVHLSDLARVLEAVEGVDAVTDLALTLDDVPVGDSALVRPDQIVCRGPLVVRLSGGA
ncbi:baseplate J/gp47 family protein [Microbacterium terricola]|uniref:Baseplate assembly protein n=1 Tax=Microbacterium terricola TaxID=344163 RepID=A0ABM8E0T5_9MICO|nr:baseplate J/gp47 family protein [Microbacterium terricola]UYK40720.1 baseplate J/gp47 family protein [Microbacterium terricola]BDV31543.1 hypothetical protein Microterr_22030 [Microbacterium terricola]